jgi:hypothetical protein
MDLCLGKLPNNQLSGDVVPEIAVPAASVRDADFSSKWKVTHWKSVSTSAFSMSRSVVSRFVLHFFLHWVFAFVVGFVAPHVALHRVSIRTLDELS